MASTKRAVTVQQVVLVVLAVALLTLAVVAGLWAGDRNRDADRSSGPFGRSDDVAYDDVRRPGTCRCRW
jgi:hypothetical protein